MMMFPVTFSDSNLDFKVSEFLDALDVLCVQLTRDLLAIAKFLVLLVRHLFLSCSVILVAAVVVVFHAIIVDAMMNCTRFKLASVIVNLLCCLIERSLMNQFTQ